MLINNKYQSLIGLTIGNLSWARQVAKYIKIYFNQIGINNNICNIRPLRSVSKFGVSELIEVTYYIPTLMGVTGPKIPNADISNIVDNSPFNNSNGSSTVQQTGILSESSVPGSHIVKFSNLMSTILPKWEIMIAQILINQTRRLQISGSSNLSTQTILMRDPILFILNPYYPVYFGINNLFYSYNINKLCNYIENWGIELNIYIRIIINPINSKILSQLISNIKSISNNNISPLFSKQILNSKINFPGSDKSLIHQSLGCNYSGLNNYYHLIGVRTQFDGRFSSRDKSSESRNSVYIYGNSINIRTCSPQFKRINPRIQSNNAIITKLGTIGYNINYNYNLTVVHDHRSDNKTTSLNQTIQQISNSCITVIIDNQKSHSEPDGPSIDN